MSWDILPKANLQYFLQKLKNKLGDLAFLNKDGVNSSKYLRGDGVWNKPVVEMSYADYQALELAGEVDPNVAYYIPDAPSLYPPVQDNGSATTLNDGDLPTGQTIVSYLNSNLVQYLFPQSKANNTSIASVTSQGIYYCDAWSDSPISGQDNGTVIVIPRSGNNLTQFYITTDISRYGMCARSRNSSGSYFDWKRISLSNI